VTVKVSKTHVETPLHSKTSDIIPLVTIFTKLVNLKQELWGQYY